MKHFVSRFIMHFEFKKIFITRKSHTLLDFTAISRVKFVFYLILFWCLVDLLNWRSTLGHLQFNQSKDEVFYAYTFNSYCLKTISTWETPTLSACLVPAKKKSHEQWKQSIYNNRYQSQNTSYFDVICKLCTLFISFTMFASYTV